MTHFILIHSATRRPLPLPCEVVDPTTGNYLTLNDYTSPKPRYPKGLVWSYVGNSKWRFLEPYELGLELIAESDFMKEQADV